jgi:hypothetical protein
LCAKASDLDAAVNSGSSPRIALVSLVVSLTPAVIAERAELEKQRKLQESIAKCRSELEEFQLTVLEACAKATRVSGVEEAMNSSGDPKSSLIESMLVHAKNQWDITGYVKWFIRWVDGQCFDPVALGIHKVRVKVDGHGEGVVQAFNDSAFCAS